MEQSDFNRYKQFFDEADKDNSGKLTLEELTAILKSKGYSDSVSKIKAMFDDVDASGDNLISFEEYMRAMGQLPEHDHKVAAVRRIFNQFDKDGNGEIDRKELEAVYKEMSIFVTAYDIEKIIKKADRDGSQTINYDEFIREVFS